MPGKCFVWNRITLESEVRGSDAKVEFTVTEVYQKEGKNWKMLALTFSSVRAVASNLRDF